MMSHSVCQWKGAKTTRPAKALFDYPFFPNVQNQRREREGKQVRKATYKRRRPERGLGFLGPFADPQVPFKALS